MVHVWSARARHLATAADLLALPEGSRFHEIVAGELVQKAAPSGEHGAAQAALAGTLFGPFSRRPGGPWRCGVPHYWIVDPMLRTVRVHRWTPEGYLVVLNAQSGHRVRAEPFEAIELQVGVLFGEDPDDD